MRPPEISASTVEERREYIKEKFRCRANCEMCGICQVYKGVSPEIAYQDYIDGKCDFHEIAMKYR